MRRFLFTCGGTAGHVNPALAIAGKLRELIPDSEFLFIGSGRLMENMLVPREGYPIENITISGFSRSLSWEGIKDNFEMLKGLYISNRQCRKLIKSFKPDVAIGTGGYVCYPVLKKAAKYGIPTFMHESNAIPGLTTKMLSGTVDKVMVAFPGMEDKYKKPENVVVVGTPVRGDFGTLTKKQARTALGIDDRPLVVSFWGSLGASVMNEFMADFICRNAKEGVFNHIHATGTGDESFDELNEMIKQRGIEEVPDNIDIRPYIDNMGTVMTAADIILCRAGASTIAELTAMGKPSILVPSPNVTDNHQEKNARAVEKAGGAQVILEKECSGESLYNAVIDLLSDEVKLGEMGKSSRALGVENSCEKITSIILSSLK